MKKNIITLGLAIIITLLIISCKEEQITEPQHHHYEAYGLNVYNADTLYMKIYNAAIISHYNTAFELSLNSAPLKFKIAFIDENGKEMEYPEHKEMVLGWIIADTTAVKATQVNNSKWEFTLKALKKANTTIELRLNHIDHPDFKTPVIPINVK